MQLEPEISQILDENPFNVKKIFGSNQETSFMTVNFRETERIVESCQNNLKGLRSQGQRE